MIPFIQDASLIAVAVAGMLAVVGFGVLVCCALLEMAYRRYTRVRFTAEVIREASGRACASRRAYDAVRRQPSEQLLDRIGEIADPVDGSVWAASSAVGRMQAIRDLLDSRGAA